MTETINDTKALTVSLAAAAVPAQGKFVGYSCPLSAEHGALIEIDATIKNIGGASGKFKIDLYAPTITYPIGGSGTFTVAGGATSAPKKLTTIAPSSGASITYTLKCIRVT